MADGLVREIAELTDKASSAITLHVFSRLMDTHPEIKAEAEEIANQFVKIDPYYRSLMARVAELKKHFIAPVPTVTVEEANDHARNNY